MSSTRMGDKLRRDVDLLQLFLDINVEEEYLQIIQAFEAMLKKWKRSDQELCEKREKLMRCESELTTLQVQLKHARNQVSVEMKRRHHAETEQENLERQLQLVRDLLVCGDAASTPLNASVMALFGKLNLGNAVAGDGRRLSTVGESSISLLSHSDISYDKTEDFVDLEECVVKPERLKPREKRRSSMVPRVSHPVAAKRTRPSILPTFMPDNDLGSVITKTYMTYTDGGSTLQAPPSVEALPRRRSRRSRPMLSALGQTSVWDSIEDEPVPQIEETELEPDMCNQELPQSAPPRRHSFISKTVILAESCAACGKRTRFGKMSLKCRDCRLLIHPECRDICPKVCVPGSVGTPAKIGQWGVADFAPSTAPRIPSLVVQCVNEIELRGLKEKGIYRIPGCDRQVKDLKQKFLRAKGPLPLNRVNDIHAVCGLLKDFLRNLKEPLVTFNLHSSFMEAADIINEEDGKAEMCQTVLKLPLANQETMAYLMQHLLRVMSSTSCNMDRNNLARVFGPTLVGHSVPEPSAVMIMQDTPRQAKVVSRLLSVPANFWDQFLANDQENVQPAAAGSESHAVSAGKGRMFAPVNSPEIESQTTPSASSVPKKVKGGLGLHFANQEDCCSAGLKLHPADSSFPLICIRAAPKNRGEPIKTPRFFTSPTCDLDSKQKK